MKELNSIYECKEVDTGPCVTKNKSKFTSGKYGFEINACCGCYNMSQFMLTEQSTELSLAVNSKFLFRSFSSQYKNEEVASVPGTSTNKNDDY